MNRPLRVLSLSTLYPNDLTPNFGVFVERQMQTVAARGDVDLTVINAIGLPPFPLSLHPRYRGLRTIAKTEVRGGVRVLRPCFALLPRFGARWTAGTLARTLLPLARKLHAQTPFDVIDAQFFHPDGLAALRVARALELPVSIKARGADIHHWGHDSATAAQVRQAARDADGVLAVSQGLANELIALGADRLRVAVHRTGLDRSVFYPRDRAIARQRLGLDVSADAPVFVCVGALIPRKGQRFAIEAVAELPGSVLLLAGAGLDEAALMQLAQSRDCADRVRFLGAVPHRDLPWVLSAADVFVLPTASEGLANAWVEALACGVPVITTPIPGAIELIDRPALGRLVARDGPAIAAAARELLASPPSQAEVVQGTEGFSWQENAAALVAHWRRLAAG